MGAALRLFQILTIVAGVVVASVVPVSAAEGMTEQPSADGAVCAGHIREPAGGLTVVSIQGARFTDEAVKKTPPRIVAFGPTGSIEWVHQNGKDLGVSWSYDIDPLPNGNIFVTATRPGQTLLYELNATTGVIEWREELPFVDTHDADMIDRHRVLIANMRNYNESSGVNEDRIVIYNRTSDRVEWEWRFTDHFPRSLGGQYTDDWTHVNDVDRVGDDILVSARNFDQVLLIDRSTGRIERRLGEAGETSILNHQHNPDYLESKRGTPTVLVADSENDRVVEYAREKNGWNRTWSTGDGVLNWPRDADRLPNGNTLIADSKGDRVLEVTPRGEVVWEVYAPWLVYDVERVPAAHLGNGAAMTTGYGDAGGSRGPTITDLNAGGSPKLKNASPPSTADLERCAETLRNISGGFPGPETGYQNMTNMTTTDLITLETTDMNGTQESGTTRVRTDLDVTGGLAVILLAAVAYVVRRRHQGDR